MDGKSEKTEALKNTHRVKINSDEKLKGILKNIETQKFTTVHLDVLKTRMTTYIHKPKLNKSEN